MSTPKDSEELGIAIAELRRELAALDAGDSAARARIEQLMAQIEGQLHEAPESLQQSFADTIREFEVEHPRLTAALERVMLALSSMGI